MAIVQESAKLGKEEGKTDLSTRIHAHRGSWSGDILFPIFTRHNVKSSSSVMFLVTRNELV